MTMRGKLMAELHNMDGYQGPGEKNTVEHLVKSLPDGWHVIPNRKLPNKQQDDVDIWVLSPNKLFVIEVKYWGPDLILGDQRWTVIKKGNYISERSNPLLLTAHKAKRAASWIREKIPAYREVMGRQVVPIVILSHPEVDWKVKPGYSVPEEIMSLGETKDLLQKLSDEGKDPKFNGFMNGILALLLDLESPESQLDSILGYEVQSELPGEPGLRVFQAEHSFTGEQVLLKCFDNSYWAHMPVHGQLNLEREILALAKIRNLGRSWSYHPPFEFELKNWTVVPLVKPLGVVSLADIFARSLEGQNDILPALAERELHLFKDAFKALAEIHAEDVLHKAICPERLWIGKSQRFVFSDFYLAHVGGLETVVNYNDDYLSQPDRAPETKVSLEFASKLSDVYSLALVLSRFRTKLFNADVDTVIAALTAVGDQIAKTLVDCLEQEQVKRPSAADVVEQLENIEEFAMNGNGTSEGSVEEPVDDTWQVGKTVGDQRFEILEKLGAGGVGTTWKVRDNRNDEIRVLKRLHGKSLFTHAVDEVSNARQLEHEGCAVVYEMPDPQTILSEYVEGVTLKEKSTSPSFTTKNIREVSARVLRILSYIHERGFVHGDVSPKNIIVNDSWSPKLIDFGLLTKVGDIQVGGTRATLAPEAALGSGVTPQSDLYSFAASLVLLMLGRPPYVGDQSVIAGRDYSISPLNEVEKEQWGDDGVALLEVLLAACNPELQQRPESAQMFIQLIEQAKPVPPEKLPVAGSKRTVNANVDNIRGLYVRSRIGSVHSLGIASDFSRATYSPTLLDSKLAPDIAKGKLKLVILTGNPGDGKTSFLEKLGDELLQAGGTTVDRDPSGWLISSSGRSFRAIYDASESTDSLSSDSLVTSALEPIAKGNYTALLAVNDGRLKEFFEMHEYEFPEYAEAVDAFFRGAKVDNPNVAIVDLKTRNIVNAKSLGLASRIIDQLVAPELWGDCTSCVAAPQCPILNNRNILGGRAKNQVLDLIEISHLKRKKRSTLRQIRSTLAWLITADLGCEDVHASPVDLTASGRLSLPELAFSAETDDPLIHEWRAVDPSQILSVEVERTLRARPITEEEIFSGHDRYQREMRTTFILEGQYNPYKHLGDYRMALANPTDIGMKERVLKGLSALIGAVGYQGKNMVITQSRNGSSWAVVRSLPIDEFEFTTPVYADEFLEVSADYLTITHSGGASLNLNLDSAELVFRAAAGEIVADRMSEAIRFEIDMFANRLMREISKTVFVVQPNGRTAKVIQADGQIVLEAEKVGQNGI